jgi:hypothetical protein
MSTCRSAAASTEPLMRTRALPIWMSMRPTAPRTPAPSACEEVLGGGPGGAETAGDTRVAAHSSRTRSGTNVGRPSSPAPRACRRQVPSKLRFRPWRRATSEMLAPGRQLSSRIAAFSSAVQRRRRFSPVINSIRRYVLP